MSAPKFAITEDQIDALVSAFYARAAKTLSWALCF